MANEQEKIDVESKTVKKTTNITELKETIKTQEIMINELKAQVQTLIALATKGNEPKEIQEEGNGIEYVTVGCRAFSGASLANKDESICYSFWVGEEKQIDIEDLKEVLKDSGLRRNKIWFEKGLFYFKDEKYYKYFAINKRVDLTWQNIKSIIMTPDIDLMIRKVKDLTKDKKDLAITHTLKYIIAQMLVDPSNPLLGFSYSSKVALENYFGNKFDELINYAGVYNILRKN